MMNNEKWTELQQAEDIAYFKADLCCYSPESYSLEEKRAICNDMISTSRAVLDAMRADFERLPADARSKLLDMLCRSGVESPSGGGMCSSEKVTRCIGSLRRSDNTGCVFARGQTASCFSSCKEAVIAPRRTPR